MNDKKILEISNKSLEASRSIRKILDILEDFTGCKVESLEMNNSGYVSVGLKLKP